MKNILLLLACVLLQGCGKDSTPVVYERVEIQDYNLIVCFRNCIVSKNFASPYIIYYEDGKLKYSDAKWHGSLKSQFFNSVTAACAKRKVKITQLSNLTFLDCFIEQIFYDAQKQEGIISFTINFRGKIKGFYIVEKVSKPEDLPKIFERAAGKVAEFIYLCQQ